MSKESELHELVGKLKQLALEEGRTPTARSFVKTGVSNRKITRNGGFANLCKLAGLEPNRPCFRPSLPSIDTTPPRTLFIDIETAAIEAKVWGLYDQNIALNQISQDWFILSYAARFLGEESMHYLDQRYSKPIKDDRQLVEGIHYLLSRADIVIGHNIDRFDAKKINARFLKYGMDPLIHYQTIDTLKIARKFFALTSNKLEYLAKFLGCSGLKSNHGKFPGMELWDQCMDGNVEAFEEMEQYNKMDVVVLEEVYQKLVKYDPRIGLQAFHKRPTCSCGGQEFIKDGTTTTKQGMFYIFRCTTCRKPFKGKENLIDKDVRNSFHKLVT